MNTVYQDFIIMSMTSDSTTNPEPSILERFSIKLPRMKTPPNNERNPKNRWKPSPPTHQAIQ